MQIDNVVNNNIEKKYASEGIKVADYVKSADCQSAQAAAVSSSNSVDMSDTIYAKPQNNKAEDDKSVVDNLMTDNSMSAESRRNEMVVVASTTTTDDYNAAKKDGYDVIVTETDKIKAVLAKAGVDISIYGDDISKEQLEEITGNEAVATIMENQLRAYDIPVTDENVSEGVAAIGQAENLNNISSDAKAYLIKNQMEPSISNIYKAIYSNGQQSISGQNSSITDTEFDEMLPQLGQILEDAGLEADEENLQQCRWLMDNNIAVTPENIKYADIIDNIVINADCTDYEFLAKSVAQAMAAGKNPMDATMSKDTLIFDRAANAQKVIENATSEDVAVLEAANKPVTIDNLAAVSENNTVSQSVTKDPVENITALRKLQEARLYMTVEANLSLLKKGISIDTEPIEQIVKILKEQENQYYSTLFGQEGVDAADDNVQSYRQVRNVFEEMRFQPAYVLDISAADRSVYEIYTAGKELQQSFSRASQSYETLMTAPRADMGDNISKAFGNVDDILNDMGLECTDANRRAVRILAYNSTEITEDNIARMKAADEQVQRAFKNMTPAVTIEMIKKGISPLDMNMEQLNAAARQIKEEIGDDSNEKYSEFLWKLEKNKDISQEERDSYIGIYRLIAQVEKSDGAVIGSLINQGADITMKNLLTAVRSGNKGDMDYKVGDDFGGVDSITHGAKIDEQISAAYNTDCIRDVLDEISPEKLEFMSDGSWLDMTPEQFKQAVEQAKEDQTLSDEYAKDQINMFREAVESPENVYAFLDRYDVRITASNLMAASRLLKNPSEMVENLWTRGEKGMVRGLLDETIEQFAESVKNPKELAEAQEKLAETAEHVMDSMIIEDPDTRNLDIRQMKILASSFKIASNMAKQENYIVPVQTADGVTGINLKIVRGEDKKGFVDIFFNGKLSGKIAASFEAKEKGISGVIAVSDEQTRTLLADNLGLFAAGINENGDEPVDIRVAYVPEVTAEKFMTQQHDASHSDDESYAVQTSRLYHLAEQFIVNVQDVLGQDSL